MTQIRLVSDNPAPTSQSGSGGGPEDPMLEPRVARLESDVAEIKLMLIKLDAKLDKLDSNLDTRFVAVEERLSGKIARLEGHLDGIGHRFAALPTTWTLLGIVFTTWALGSGILIFAMNFLKR